MFEELIRVLIALVLSFAIIFSLGWIVTYGIKDYIKTIKNLFLILPFLIIFLSSCQLRTLYPPYYYPDTGNKDNPIILVPSTNKYPTPIIIGSNNWESNIIGEVSVLYDENIFKMWYRGSFAVNSQIGYAISADGINWTKNSNPLPVPLPSGKTTIYFPFVLKVSSTYYMYASCYPGDSCYRWSSLDGTNWILNNSGNPVLSPEGAGWEANAICNTSVIYDTDDFTWKMLYEALGGGFQIGYAYSVDGLSWTKYTNNPVLPVIPLSWKSGNTGNPDLLKINGYYYAVYGGNSGPGWVIGSSKSSNLIDWEENTNSPFIIPTEIWENTDVADPSIVILNNTVHIYYGANQTTTVQGLFILSNWTLDNFLNP